MRATRRRAPILQDGEWVIDGSKQFITNAGTDISGVVVITALTGTGEQREISNILVANGTPGYEPGEQYRKMGWNASDTRPLSFTDCRVPAENLVGHARRAGSASSSTPSTSAGSVSRRWASALAQGAFDQALAYAKERRAFGQPISKFQSIQVKLAISRPRSTRRGCSSTRRRG